MSVEDAEGQRTLARYIEFEILPRGPTTPILLSKPWKTQMGVIQFCELDVVYMPDFSQPSYLRRWTKLPYIGTVADLESQEPPFADVSTVDLRQADHSIQDNEIEDQAAQWMLSTDKYAQLPKKVWLEQPIEQGRLETLQCLLPVEVDDPKYQAAHRQNHIKFDPYQVNSKPDVISEERAERVAQALEIQFGEQGIPEECQHLQALLKVKHLAFAKTTSDCKQNCVVICDPKLIEEPPDTAWHSKTQALSPPQKEFLHQQVHKLIDNSFLIKVPGDQVQWISKTHIVPKPAAEIKSNISIEELQHQVNASLKATGLEHDPNMPDPTLLPTQSPEAQMTKAHYWLMHNYTPINRYMCDTAFVPGDITIKVSKLLNKKFLFKGDGCAGFFIVANSPLATLLSVTYIKDLGSCGYMVMPFGFKVGPSLYYQLITTAFGNLFDWDSDFWMDDVAASRQDFGAYFTWLRAFLD
ncbi:uncharacterized protein UBRO_20804 [Ustilago bromivora]|uniref:Reverse transcriptase domain-containing protein n=1 Tax=Ustilago bromivora TaxID=307758 RepID=A0A1K0GU60_9BASI|nr:uncharacterized protein UBRO_20804 [Ustilago bromivora]